MTIMEAIDSNTPVCPRLYTLIYLDNNKQECSKIIPANDFIELEQRWSQFATLHKIPCNAIISINF